MIKRARIGGRAEIGPEDSGSRALSAEAPRGSSGGRWDRRTPFVRFAPCRPTQVGRQPGQEGCRRQAQAHVPVPPVPGARLAMAETEIVLGALEALLNRPAQPRRAGQFAQRDTNRRKGKIVGPFVGLPPAATDQEPVLEAPILA